MSERDGREYQVRWKREGLPMRRLLFQTLDGASRRARILSRPYPIDEGWHGTGMSSLEWVEVREREVGRWKCVDLAAEEAERE